MAASQNTITLSLTEQDSAGVNIVNRTIGPITYSGAVGRFNVGIFPTTGATTLTLPTGITTALQFYFKNTASTGNITINWTPMSATGSVIAQVLTPGGVLIFWQASSGASGGVSAITGTSDTVNTTFEYYVGG